MDGLAKNNVSYFEAGYRAGLIMNGMDRKEVDNIFHTTTSVPNAMRALLRVYDRKDDANEALIAMEDEIECA